MTRVRMRRTQKSKQIEAVRPRRHAGRRGQQGLADAHGHHGAAAGAGARDVGEGADDADHRAGSTSSGPTSLIVPSTLRLRSISTCSISMAVSKRCLRSEGSTWACGRHWLTTRAAAPFLLVAPLGGGLHVPALHLAGELLHEGARVGAGAVEIDNALDRVADGDDADAIRTIIESDPNRTLVSDIPNMPRFLSLG